MPFVNWSLFVMIIVGGGAVPTSSNLAGLRHRGDAGHDHHHGDDLLRHPLRLEVPAGRWCFAATGFFIVIDISPSSASNMLKLVRAGGSRSHRQRHVSCVFILMVTASWWLRTALRDDGSIDLRKSLPRMRCSCPPPRAVPAIAVFLSADAGMTPNADAQPQAQQVLSTTCSSPYATTRVPWIGFDKRIEIRSLGHAAGRWCCTSASRNDPDIAQA